MDAGREIEPEELARIMLGLQRQGCHNINFVTPTHVVPQILEALPQAIEQGLRVPLVYNSSGYDSVETLRLLDGVIDIYMPDFKFWQGRGADYLGGVADYGETAKKAVAEMHRQVGDLRIERGVAVGGLLVRHLVMPRRVADTASIMRYLAFLSPNTYVNIMSQYRPHFRARGDPVIGTRITSAEYAEALDAAVEAGLSRLDR
jgi:putative pyruvate formate lyase activating enzyme